MKFYTASRLKHKNKVKEVIETLEDKGHNCTHKWINGQSLKPYEKNLKQSQLVATKQVEAIKDSDVFILLYPDKGGAGMYVELGVALAKNKKIFVVGEFKKPIFLFHPAVNHVDSAKKLLELI